MPRFRLRTLLVITALSAGYFAVGAGAGYLAATAVAVAIAAIVWAIRSPWRRWGLLLRIPTLLVGGVAFWLAGVDGQWTVEDCPDCRWSNDILEIRVLGVPAWVDNWENWQAITFALRDLGVPCQHPKLVRWLKHRYWGNTFCAYPCINGISGFAEDDRYTAEVAARVKAIERVNPGFGERLRERVVVEEDYDYFWSGFMTDQIVLGAYDAGNAVEAKRWLAEAPPDLKEEVLYGNEEWTPEYIQQMYDDLGVSEVIIYWVYEKRSWSKPGDAWGQMVVRLPIEPTKRKEVIDAIAQRRFDDGDESGLKDYGQRFAWP